MSNVQLVGVRPGVAIVQKDNETAVEITWKLLYEAQQQDGLAGYVYRWIMREYCRCEYEQRRDRPWRSPRREAEEIATELRNQDAREASQAEALQEEKEQKKRIEEYLRQRDEEERRVKIERQQVEVDDPWWPIPWWEVPEGIRFDTPGRNQGQIVEVSYGTFGRYEAGSTDPYMMVTDYSDGSSRTYKRRSIGG